MAIARQVCKFGMQPALEAVPYMDDDYKKKLKVMW